MASPDTSDERIVAASDERRSCEAGPPKRGFERTSTGLWDPTGAGRDTEPADATEARDGRESRNVIRDFTEARDTPRSK